MTATATVRHCRSHVVDRYFFAGLGWPRLGWAGSERLLDYVDQFGGFFEKGSLLSCVRACVGDEIITLRLCDDWKTNRVSE